MMKESNNWNTSLYDDKHAFVFKMGEDLVKLLDPQAGEQILDLGCGTGYLTNLIAKSGAHVIGIDSSATMLQRAQESYPAIDFKVMNAEDFHFNTGFDAIFSNAVLHWVSGYRNAVKCMYKNLKPGGRIVVEFGGQNNVNRIVDALKNTLLSFGYTQNAQKQIWYFPSVAQYSAVLETEGFTVRFVSYFDRNTELNDNANGIKDWIHMFGEYFLKDIKPEHIEEILDQTQQRIKPTNYKDGKWFADYKRLRVVAYKE